MKAEYLLLAVDAHVATVTINRPDKGNSLAPEVLGEIEEMFSDLAAREEVNVIVLTGGEKYFSAGFDLKIRSTL
jgi:enoyl-CoA hydratase/carnithine racemase